MPLYEDGKYNRMVIGDYHPVKVMDGDRVIVEARESEKTGEALEWEDTYNDVLHAELVGRSEQAVTVQGKNLYADSNVSGVKNYYLILKHPLPIGTYTISAVVTSSDTDASTSLVFFVKADSVAMFNRALTRGARSSATFTLPEPCVRLIFYASNTSAHSAGDTFSFTDIQIELGTVATPYEPFTPNSPSPEYPSPIHSAGNCELISSNGGTLSSSIAIPVLSALPNGVKDTLTYKGADAWEHVQRVGVKVFDGTEDWDIPTQAITGFTPFRYLGLWNVSKPPYLLSHLPFVDISYATPPSSESFRRWDLISGQMFALISNSRIPLNDIIAWKAFLAAQYAAGTPVTVQYQLATPIITDLNLGELRTFPRFTRIEQDGAIKATITARARVAI